MFGVGVIATGSALYSRSETFTVELEMSSNIYEDPDLITNVKYSKGAGEDRGERVEVPVDIYESVDANRHVSTRDAGARAAAVQRNPFRAVALVLALLCLLLVVGVVALSKLYISVTLGKEQLQYINEELQSKYEELHGNMSKSFCQETNNITEWRRFGCSCYYKSTEMKNWTESRRDCRSRGADLVVIESEEEQDFVSELNESFWIGLQSVSPRRWEKEGQWQWLDGKPLTFTYWQIDVNLTPVDEVTVYIDLGGKWAHTNNGSKRWICEKPII